MSGASLSVVTDPDPEPIAIFEGQGVFSAGVEIRNASGGLNDALDVDPTVHEIGDTIFVVLRCDVVEVDHKPIKGEEDKLTRIHVLRATDCTVAEPDLVSAIIDDQRARIQTHRDELAKQKALFEDERRLKASEAAAAEPEGGKGKGGKEKA